MLQTSVRIAKQFSRRQLFALALRIFYNTVPWPLPAKPPPNPVDLYHHYM